MKEKKEAESVLINPSQTLFKRMGVLSPKAMEDPKATMGGFEASAATAATISRANTGGF